MDDHEGDPRHANDDQAQSQSPREPEESRGRPEPEPKRNPAVISTTDRVVTEGPGQQAEWRQHPDATLVTETSRVDRPIPAYLLPAPGGASLGDSQEPPRKNRNQGPEKTSDENRGNVRSDGDDRARNPEKVQPSPWRNVMLSSVLALVAGMIGAGVVVYFFDSSKAEGKQSASDGQANSQKKSGSEEKSKSKGSGKEGDKPAADETAQSGSAIPGFTQADDADTLRRQIEHLSERIDQLGQRLDTASRSHEEVPPDLRTLQIKVGNLTRTMEDVNDLPSRVRRLDSRLEDLQQELKTLRDQLSSSREGGSAAGSDRKEKVQTFASRPVVTAPPTSEQLPDIAMAQGIALFKDGNYPEASNIFRKLQITRPRDARVWYYSALSVGLMTGDWTQSVRELVTQGIDCERAGSPEKDKIDVAFSGLSDAQGRKWLNSYREQATRPR